MREFNITGKNPDYILAEINHDINLLYVIPCVYTRNFVLNHLRDRMSMLEAAMAAMSQPLKLQTQAQALTQENQTTFTPEELSRFDGKNGRPAYTAVNGIVYDVTNNAAWAAATHFGLAAGKDLTGAFASCHAGEPVLNKLKVVGKLEARNLQ